MSWQEIIAKQIGSSMPAKSGDLTVADYQIGRVLGEEGGSPKAEAAMESVVRDTAATATPRGHKPWEYPHQSTDGLSEAPAQKWTEHYIGADEAAARGDFQTIAPNDLISNPTAPIKVEVNVDNKEEEEDYFKWHGFNRRSGGVPSPNKGPDIYPDSLPGDKPDVWGMLKQGLKGMTKMDADGNYGDDNRAEYIQMKAEEGKRDASALTQGLDEESMSIATGGYDDQYGLTPESGGELGESVSPYDDSDVSYTQVTEEEIAKEKNPGARAAMRKKQATGGSGKSGLKRPDAPEGKELGTYVMEQSDTHGVPWEDVLFEMYAEKNPFYRKGMLKQAIGRISAAHFDEFRNKNKGNEKGYRNHLMSSLNSSAFSAKVPSRKSKKPKKSSRYSHAYDDLTASSLIDVLRKVQSMTASQLKDDWKNIGISAGGISADGEIVLNEDQEAEMRTKGKEIQNKSVRVANQIIPTVLGANETLESGEESKGMGRSYESVRTGLARRLKKVYAEAMKSDKALAKTIKAEGGADRYANQIIISMGLWSPVNTRSGSKGGKKK